MSINVYWTCVEDEWMLAEQPFSVAKNFFENFKIDKNNKNQLINKCPSIKEELNNLFGIKSIYDYSFYIENNNVFSKEKNQFFFDEHLLIRSLEQKFFSFTQRYIFYTDSPSLRMTANIFPFLENNNVTEKCNMIPGSFDIGKWYRNIEFPFFLKNQFNHFKILQEETMFYIKFETKEKINFIQYRYSDSMKQYRKDYDAISNLQYWGKLGNFYKYSKNKKLLLNEIERNLV